MRKLSFQSFLKRYITELTKIERFEIRRLAAAAEKSEKLRVPLLLYIAASDMPWEKREALLGEVSHDEYNRVFNGINDIVAEARKLPAAYQRIIGGYVRLSRTHDNENDSKRAIADRITERRRGLELSDYRICHELGINPGNFNAFFYHDNDNALSLAKVDLIAKFVEFCRERLMK